MFSTILIVTGVTGAKFEEEVLTHIKHHSVLPYSTQIHTQVLAE